MKLVTRTLWGKRICCTDWKLGLISNGICFSLNYSLLSHSLIVSILIFANTKWKNQTKEVYSCAFYMKGRTDFLTKVHCRADRFFWKIQHVRLIITVKISVEEHKTCVVSLLGSRFPSIFWMVSRLSILSSVTVPTQHNAPYFALILAPSQLWLADMLDPHTLLSWPNQPDGDVPGTIPGCWCLWVHHGSVYSGVKSLAPGEESLWEFHCYTGHCIRPGRPWDPDRTDTIITGTLACHWPGRSLPPLTVTDTTLAMAALTPGPRNKSHTTRRGRRIL